MNRLIRSVALSALGAFVCFALGCWLLAKPASTHANYDATLLANQILSSLDSNAGLCVHLGASDGKLTTQMSKGGHFLVHGLCTDAVSVETSRETIDTAGLAGVVSVEQGSFEKLPYADRIVNIIVADDLPALLEQRLNIDEVTRVLRPGGVAWLGSASSEKDGSLTEQMLTDLLKKHNVEDFEISKQNGIWAVFKKTRRQALDSWTHTRHDPSGNPVSTDEVIGLPSGVRWVAGPNWPTGYRKSAIDGVVSSEDRLVYIFEDEEVTATGPKPHNSLVARDAFNGLLLWKQRKTDQSRALAAVGEYVYTMIEDNGPLVAINVNTGKVERSYVGTDRPQQVAIVDGLLVVDTQDGVGCYDSTTVEREWNVTPRPGQFLVGDGTVFVHTAAREESGERVSRFTAIDLEKGKQIWSRPTKEWSTLQPRLILYQHGLLVASNSDGNHGISAEDGRLLWSYKYPLIGHGGSFEKILYMHGLLWVHTAEFDKTKRYAWEGLDPRTGEVKQRIIQPKEFTYKHRCSYDVATQQYFMLGSMDFANVKSGEYDHFSAARNSCRTGGLVPANGLVYTFPHGCGCYPMLRGFLGLASTELPNTDSFKVAGDRLVKGPSYGAAVNLKGKTPDEDWPTYRRDAVRSGSTRAAGPRQLDELWTGSLSEEQSNAWSNEWDYKDGGRSTSPVIAGETAIAASIDHHRVVAFDAKTGKQRWQFTAGGRVDCPPTIYHDLCLFGARDGWVYCLRMTDGTVVWRFLAAPDDRRIVVYGQLESPWPVVGGVLEYEGLAYFVVGRHAGSDGGLFVYAAEPDTGRLVWAVQPKDYPGVPDLLNGLDGSVQMASHSFDAKTGKQRNSPAQGLQGGRLSLLNDAWYKRPLALRKNLQLWSAGGNKTGQMLSFSPIATCGFRACESVDGGNGTMKGDAKLFSIPEKGKSGKSWQLTMPNTSRMKGMVIADDRLYVAGRLCVGRSMGNLVRVYSLSDGKTLDEYAVEDEFVHDCLAVAAERVYVTTQGGKLICLGEK